MKKTCSALALVLAALLFIPASVEASTAISTLGSATVANSFDNANYQQEWTWNTLNGYGLYLSSTSASVGGGDALLNIFQGGTSSSTGLTTYGARIINNQTTTGANATDYGVYAFAGGYASHNYGVYGTIEGATHAGDAGVWGDAPDANGPSNGPTYGIYGTNGSATGYAGYFNNSNGGYAAAFSGGNVGIGTTTPGYPLSVAGVGYSTGGFSVGSDGSSFTPTGLNAIPNYGTGYVSSSVMTSLSGYAGLVFYTHQSEYMRLDSSGRLGIQTTSPSYTLHVNGSVAGTSAYVNTSDIRYKKNIEPLRVGLKEIEQLKPVTFEWKEPKEVTLKDGKHLKDPAMKGQQIGFVAQDVEKILPSVVVTEDNDEKTKGMKYAEIIPVLVLAIQQQQQEIEKDEATIAAMKTKLGI